MCKPLTFYRLAPCLRVSANALHDYIWGLSILLFSFINEVGFLVNKGLLFVYDKQNNTWLLVDMEFLLSCSIRHLTRSLCSFVSYRFEHSKRNCISTRAHVLFSIYHINCGVLQGFLDLKKAVATHVKKHGIFSRVLIFNQLHTRRSPSAPLGQVDE